MATGELHGPSIRATPRIEADGQISGAINSWHDITELKRREPALAAEREYFAVTLASLGDAVIVTDPRRIIT